MLESSPPQTATGGRLILQAALDLFAANGYEGVSVNSIAERAGVCKSNVFHHFASKEALYLEVLRTASLEWGDDITEVNHVEGSFSDRLRAFIGGVLQRLLQRPLQSRLMLREILDNGALRAEQMSDDVYQRNFEMEMAIFRRAQADGELRRGLDPAVAWMLTMSACLNFFQIRDLLRHIPSFNHYAEDPEIYADQVCAGLLGGIADSSGSDSRDAGEMS